MTTNDEWDLFLKHEKLILDWMNYAQTDEERRKAATALQGLHKQRTDSQNAPESLTQRERKRKPRKKLTKVERFDKGNSRREAIMAQKAKGS